jgi:hypothetical protein
MSKKVFFFNFFFGVFYNIQLPFYVFLFSSYVTKIEGEEERSTGIIYFFAFFLTKKCEPMR